MKTSYFRLLASALCVSLFFACTPDIDHPPPYSSSSGVSPLSSSDVSVGSSPASNSSSSQPKQSSSSNGGITPEYSYCVFASDEMCLAGPASSCPPGGTLSNACPYLSSSSSPAGGSSSSVPPVASNCSLNGGTVNIGGQVWMAENLNCNVSGSKCYDNDESNCDKYGRLYDWSTAMGLPASCNSTSCSSQIQSKHRGICPSGWHIPSNADWDRLFRYADGTSGTDSPYDSPTAGRHLKSASGWYDNGNGYNGNGLDTYGFAALPGGNGYSGGNFSTAGYSGYWWSASENGASNAYFRGMDYYYESAGWFSIVKSYLFSVRCLQD